MHSSTASETREAAVLVGGGQAGAAAALGLRRLGYPGSITLLAGEPHLPYERPPLSKAFLTGTLASLRPIADEATFREADIDIRLGATATRIDPHRRRVVLEGGAELRYGCLVLATGGTPRMLRGAPADGRRIFGLRSIPDAEALRAALSRARRLLVVGGSWLGLELAAAARALRVEVTVLEAAPRLCDRLAVPALSAWLADLHASRGVEIVLGCDVSLQATADGVAAACRGRVWHADLAAVAIGIEPNCTLAEDAGLACRDGILVDEACRTSQSGVFAVGDVARMTRPALGGSWRIESWDNANQTGDALARSVLGLPGGAVQAPWFWSSQYEHTVYIAGVPRSEAAAGCEQVRQGAKPVWRIDAGQISECCIAIDDALVVRRTLKQINERLADMSFEAACKDTGKADA